MFRPSDLAPFFLFVLDCVFFFSLLFGVYVVGSMLLSFLILMFFMRDLVGLLLGIGYLMLHCLIIHKMR